MWKKHLLWHSVELQNTSVWATRDVKVINGSLDCFLLHLQQAWALWAYEGDAEDSFEGCRPSAEKQWEPDLATAEYTLYN